MNDDSLELQELIDLACEGALVPEQVERLEALLLGNPTAQQLYLDHLRLDGRLRWEFGQAAMQPPVPERSPTATPVNSAPVISSPSPLMGEGSNLSPSPLMGEGRGEGSSIAPAHVKPVKSPVLGFLGGVIDYVGHSRTLMFWLLCGTFGLYFAVQLGSLMLSRFWAQNAAQVADNRGAGTEKHGDAGDHPALGVSGKIVARLTNAVDCQWKVAESGGAGRSDLQPLDLGTEFHVGQKLNLAAGLAELTFDSGAKVILHAPARFEVTDALGGDLERGKLTAKVPHTASGFTIATPGGKVVDLGTEFGVKVRDDGVMNVIVYVGEVQVESGAGGGTGAGPADQVKVVRLKAGQAITVGPDHVVKTIPPENERYIRDLGPLGEKPVAEAAYVEFMKSLKPAVWFRMEGQETERVLHDEVGGRDAKLLWDGPGNPFVKGPIGKSLWLRGEALKDGAILADYPKADHKKLTVAAWAYADSRPRWATVVKNWGGLQGKGGQFSLELCLNDPRRDRESCDISASICQTDGNLITVREGVGHPFPLNEWQHVAFVADGAKLRLYRQGREVAVVEYTSLKYPPPLKSLGIGIRAPDEVHAGAVDCWSGKLDEVAVFNEALSPDDIKRLAGAAPR